MGKIIAVLNEKGGVAKTTTVKNLSVGLACREKKVLAIDLDPSANLTSAFGHFQIPEGQQTILDLFRISSLGDDIPDEAAILHTDEGVDLIPSITAFHDFESALLVSEQKEIVLRRIISSFSDKYDYIFIDCPAGLGIFVTNALYAAEQLIIPVQPQFLGANAMMSLFKRINDVRKFNGTGTKPEVLGILFTMVRTNTKNDTDVMEYFKPSYEKMLFKTYIPNSVRFAESDSEGMSIYRYAPKSASAFVYSELVDEFIEMEEIK